MAAHVAGGETAHVDLGAVEVEVALDAGPRIVSYNRPDGPSLFARLLGEVIEHPAVGTFSFIGGHRLWRAPEVPAVTYHPDDRPVMVDPFHGGLTVTGNPDPDGLVPSIALTQEGDLTIVDHVLRNTGRRTVRCAPWAITQFTPGGVAVLPLSLDPADPDGVQPNRSIVLWPYTDPSIPEVDLRAAELRVHASTRPARTKLGTANRRGWLAYHLDGELFVKWGHLHDDGREYADLGASAQCFRDERFLELETLGPLTALPPGREVRHQEVWATRQVESDDLDAVLARLPIDPRRAT